MMPIARWLMIIGGVTFLSGALIYIMARTGIFPGRLPGDIRLQTGNMTCVIALGTSLLLSLILTLLLNVIAHFIRK